MTGKKSNIHSICFNPGQTISGREFNAAIYLQKMGYNVFLWCLHLVFLSFCSNQEAEPRAIWFTYSLDNKVCKSERKRDFSMCVRQKKKVKRREGSWDRRVDAGLEGGMV